MNKTSIFLILPLIFLGGIFGVISTIHISAQQFAKIYTPRKPAAGSGESFWRTRNVETKAVCAIGEDKYAVVSTLEIEVSANDWQTTGQVMVINGSGSELYSKTYHTGLPAPLSQIKFNNIAYIPKEQLNIFCKTIDTMDTLIVPAAKKQKVRFFTGRDSNYADTNGWVARSGVLLVAGARRPLYPVDKGGEVLYEVCDNYQAAYYAIDVDNLDTIVTGSFACNLGRDTNNANWVASEYHSLRFEYQGYVDKSGDIRQVEMRQRVAFVGSARAETGNLTILASRSDLYYIATGSNYNATGYLYPSFITRTFRGSIESYFKDEEGLDIDMRYRDAYGDKNDWMYVVCGYSKAQYVDDTIERAISFIVNDTLDQAAHHNICVKEDAWVVFGDNRPSRATAVTWAAPQNDPNSEVRWFNALNNGYIIAGSRQRDGMLGTSDRAFTARLPFLGLSVPNIYIEYGLGIPDTISSHPGYSILSRTIKIDSTPGGYEGYNFYLTGWWNDLNETNSAPTARWLQLNDDLTVAGGYEYIRTQTALNYGYRMCNSANSNGFVIVGTMGLDTVNCDTNYRGGGLPYIIKVDTSGAINPILPICDIAAVPREYTCEGDKEYSPGKNPVVECSIERRLDCSMHNPPAIQYFAATKITPCEYTLCRWSGSEIEREQPLEKGSDIRYDRRENIDQLIISPNPANKVFTVFYSAGAALLEVRNILGVMIYSARFDGKAIVSTEMLPIGIYIVEVIGKNNSRSTAKVMIH